MVEFTLDPKFFTDVMHRKEWGMYDHKETLTNEELVKVLTGEDRCSSIWTENHPEFEKLRETLGEQGYISIQRGWCNGDRVLRPFNLNGALFEVGEKFASPHACGYDVTHKLQLKKENKMKHTGKQ